MELRKLKLSSLRLYNFIIASLLIASSRIKEKSGYNTNCRQTKLSSLSESICFYVYLCNLNKYKCKKEGQDVLQVADLVKKGSNLDCR